MHFELRNFLSSPEYPVFDAASGVEPQASPPLPPPARIENPSWSGWDVLSIAVLTIASIMVFLFATTFAVQRLLYPHEPAIEVAKYPMVTVVAQLLAYFVVLGFMVALVRRAPQPFGEAIRWNWPQNWLIYLFGGVVLSLGLQAFAHLLPMPKELPIDRFFQTAPEAWALSIFGTTLAPLFEEFFFRGFLYPVLARRLGVVVSILLTSVGFGLIHAPQLGRAWGPVLVVFIVGLALTITRAVTKSVAASMLIHVAYNTTISVLIFIATDSFRHLEKLNQ